MAALAYPTRRLGAAGLLLGATAIAGCTGARYTPRTRTYYVAAEAVAWNYMPDAHDSVFGRAPPSPWGDSLVYPKLRYVGYSDSTFATPTTQPPWAGILGPVIRGVVRDTIQVVFRNRTTQPLSVHPHGVRYAPHDEGALYHPTRGGGDSVTPGGQYVYTWFAEVPSGPAPGEPSSRVWLYECGGPTPRSTTVSQGPS